MLPLVSPHGSASMARLSHHCRCSSGALLGPLFLRAALAITFIWAGLGKVIPLMPLDSSQAALLTSMGVSIPVAPGVISTPASATAPDPDVLTKPLPPPDPTPIRPAPSEADSPIAPTPAERAVNPGSSPLPFTQQVTPPAASAPRSSEPPAAELAPRATEIEVRRMWGLALRLHASAHPAADGSGKVPMKLWPEFLGKGNWPRYFAIAVVIAELAGGVLVAIGLFTRLGAFLLIGVMVGAIWLDQLGPAMQVGNTTLLILPGYGVWDIAAWRPLLWQFSLFCSACALALLGAGVPSLDRALGFMKGRGDDDDL